MGGISKIGNRARKLLGAIAKFCNDTLKIFIELERIIGEIYYYIIEKCSNSFEKK